MRLFKKVILPCELVGLLGNKKTKFFYRVIEESSMRWNIDFPIVPKPSKKSISIWEDFLDWLLGKQGATICDFNDKCKSKIQASSDDNYVKVMKEEEIMHYKKTDQACGRDKYEKLNSCEAGGWRDMIGSIEPNGGIQIDSKFPPYAEFNNNMQGALFPLEIKEDIENSKAFAASDASCKNNQMGGYWIIANATKQYEQENKLYYKNWKVNASKGAEAIALLDLLTVI